MITNRNIGNKKYILNEISLNREDDIKKAINKVLKVRMTYNDEKPHVISNRKGYKERYILPVAYGLTKNGKKAIRAYQSSGSTKRGVPKWKLFLLDNIVSWNNGKRSFKEFGNQLIRLGLNTTGDKSMTTLYAITPIANPDVQVAKNSNPITPNPITKNTVVPKNDSQNINTDQSEKSTSEFTSAINKNASPIYNRSEKPYINNKIESPDTEPIMKTDLVGNQETNDISNDVESNTIDTYTTEPIEKDDINGANNDEIEKIKNDFNDMLSRMNNVHKNNNEEEIE